jgi:hypothetical protein
MSLCVSAKTIWIKWEKFRELLKNCKHYMWLAAGRKGSKGVSMGKNAGTEFVDSVFGRDRAEGGRGGSIAPSKRISKSPH